MAKAAVQAAIGAIPQLAIAVLSIVLTASFEAVGIKALAKKLLTIQTTYH